MDPYKTNRLNNAIQKTLSQLLQLEVKDPRVGFVTIGGVSLNRDHSVARVYYSVMGDDEAKQRSLAGLKKARGFLQGKLGKVLGLRQTPELRFFYDDSLDRSLELENVLKELEARGEFEGEAGRRSRLTLADLPPPPELIEALCGADSFWVVPHWNPDPDAMGSALALGAALRAMGKDAEVFAYPDPAVGLNELPGYDRTVPAAEGAALLEEAPPDLLILVDCHRTDRCGPLSDLLPRIDAVWTIDHHLVSGRQTPVPGWVEARACSAATLVHQVIAELAAGAGDRCAPFTIDVEMATCLYAGLVNDTGGFRFPNTLPVSFELARRLALLGVDTSAVARKTLYRFRREGVVLLQLVLGSFEFHARGRVLSLRVDREMLARSGAVLADTEGFVNIGTSVEGVEFVVLLKELDEDRWRISLRAPGGGNVQEVAARYGGGGHRQAAGCTIAGSGDEVCSTLVAELIAALPSGTS